MDILQRHEVRGLRRVQRSGAASLLCRWLVLSTTRLFSVGRRRPSQQHAGYTASTTRLRYLTPFTTTFKRCLNIHRLGCVQIMSVPVGLVPKFDPWESCLIGHSEAIKMVTANYNAIAVLAQHCMHQQRHTVCSLQPIIEQHKYLWQHFCTINLHITRVSLANKGTVFIQLFSWTVMAVCLFLVFNIF